MEKCYLVVVHLDNTHYVQLTESGNSYALSAFETIKDALKQFNGFRQKALSSCYENHISGSMGVINLQPHIIEVEKNNPKTLKKYLIEDRPYKLSGSVIGSSVNMVGVKVKGNILNLSVCNVADEYIGEVYRKTIIRPKKSTGFKISKIKFWSFYSVVGFGWFRLFGVGIYWKDTSNQKYGMSFSERNGYKKFLKIGSWIIGTMLQHP